MRSVIRAAMRSSYTRLVENEPRFDDDEPEGVHQARVATRRLRSDLRTFEPWLDEEFVTNLRGELRWLGSELGSIRDLDVLSARLHADAEHLPPAEAESARRAIRRLDADREAARRELHSMVHSERYVALRDALGAASAGTMHEPAHDASKPARTLTRAAHNRWKKLRREVDRMGKRPSDDALHQVRIRAKRARYAAEACIPARGKPARRFAKAMAEIQDVLGEHHDAIVAGTWLAKTAHECTPTEAYALGMIAALERSRVDEARRAFFVTWKRARRRSLRRWMD